jgi:Raf kinase inhibitor-like YbhB/YbcL family protein
MISKFLSLCTLGAAAVALGSAAGAPAADAPAAAGAAADFTVTSETFKELGFFPRKVSNKNPQNPNCVGDNVAPQLSWKNMPAGTKSFAILMDDPEGRLGAGAHHMVIYGIPPTVTSFAEGELNKPSDKYVGGKTNVASGAFMGPCTPPGTQHHYSIVVIATDFEPKELPPGLSHEEFVAKLWPEGGTARSKGATGILGLFQNPKSMRN